MPKLFYGLAIVAAGAAAILAVIAYVHSQLPGWERTAATDATALWYGAGAIGAAASAALWLAVGKGLEHLEEATVALRHIAHNTDPRRAGDDRGLR